MKKRKIIKKNQKDLPRIFLSKVKIGNLKAFKGENEIEFAPMINLIFGKNSAGKSTINQALRLYRQSYGINKLTPFNYESPPELRGKGGLDIEVGYEGLVNNGNNKSNITLGIETNEYSKKDKKVLNKSKSLTYTYKYSKNFYKNKNLIKERTVLDKISYSNPGGSVTVKLKNHVMFREGSQFDLNLQQIKRIKSGEFFFSRLERRKTTDENIYKSIYDPYYYETEFNIKNIEIKSLEQTYDKLLHVDNKLIADFFEKFLKFISKNLNFLDSKSKKNEEDIDGGYAKRMSALKPYFKKCEEIRKRNDENLNNRIKEFLQDGIAAFITLADEFMDWEIKKGFLKEDKINLKKDLLKLINFFKQKKTSKESFIKFFKTDICQKNKDLIFYNGFFMKKPSETERISYFDSKEVNNYLINILLYLISNSAEKLTVSLVNGYYPDRYAGQSHASLEAITQVMDKFVVAPGLRQIPKRYFVKGLQTDYVGPSAENLGELLANPKIADATNKWFSKLEIPYNVKIEPSGNYYEIVFLPRNSKIKVSSMHVGLGYPLILPFIVQCIIANNKIILIEEPEVHLHPKLEADLADLIVESSLERNNQFIIETHSEDFLLRILKSIRHKKLNPEDISVNYVKPNFKKGSSVTKIKINRSGQYVQPWKDNLFADRIKELE